MDGVCTAEKCGDRPCSLCPECLSLKDSESSDHRLTDHNTELSPFQADSEQVLFCPLPKIAGT